MQCVELCAGWLTWLAYTCSMHACWQEPEIGRLLQWACAAMRVTMQSVVRTTTATDMWLVYCDRQTDRQTDSASTDDECSSDACSLVAYMWRHCSDLASSTARCWWSFLSHGSVMLWHLSSSNIARQLLLSEAVDIVMVRVSACLRKIMKKTTDQI